MLNSLPQRPPDKIIKLIQEFRDDPRERKLDLGVGVYRDVSGITPIMRAIKTAERRPVGNRVDQDLHRNDRRGGFQECDGQARPRRGCPGRAHCHGLDPGGNGSGSPRAWNSSGRAHRRPGSGCRIRHGRTTSRWLPISVSSFASTGTLIPRAERWTSTACVRTFRPSNGVMR